METPPFEGVIGDDWRDSTPWWPDGPDAAGRARPTWCWSSSTTWASPSSAATAPTSTPRPSTAWPRRAAPHQLPHHGALLADPGLPADRAQPPPQRAGPGGRPGRGVPRLQRRDPEGERLPVRDPPPARLRHLRRGQVAPHPRRRDAHGRARGTAGRWPGASTAGTASTAARPISSCRRCTTTTTRWPPPTLDRGGLPPERRPGRPGHRPAGRPPGRRRRPAVLPLLLHRRLPLAPPRAPGVDRAVPRSLRPGVGRVAGGDLRPPARAGARCPRAPRWRPGRRGCRPGTTCRADEQRVAARFMECFAAFLSYTDAQLARLLDFLEQTGDRDDTIVILVSDNGASSEGGADGSINDNRLQNVDPAGPDELVQRIDELGGPDAHNNYPWGWTMAGNTPFKRWKREVHEGGVADPCIVSWPAGIAAGRWGPPPVRPRHRHPAHRARAGRHRGPRHHRVRAPDPHRRDQLRRPARPRRCRRAAATAPPSTSRCSAAGPSTTTGGRR